MAAKIFIIAAFKIQVFGFSLPEPLIMFLIGALLILLPIFARRLTSRVITSAEALHESVHETLNNRKAKKAN